MPDCSVCGYVVDMARSCKRSMWRLFKDRPDILTPGRFFRVPRETPALPLPHYYWNRVWVSDYIEEGSPLGEWSGRTQYDKGIPPREWMQAVLIGEPACIIDGERMLPPAAPPVMDPNYEINDFAGPAVDFDLPQPFVEKCYPDPTRGGLQELQAYIEHTIRPTHVANVAAEWIRRIYLSDPTVLDDMIRVMGPALATNFVEPTEDKLPGSAIVIGPAAVIVVISGTTNVIQWVTQILNNPGPMLQRADYATFALWEHSANAVLNRLVTLGDDNRRPILLAGHSLGGAAASVLAAKLKRMNQARDVRLLTFGSPAQGDKRLRTFLTTVPALHSVNPADPIPAIPPSSFFAFALNVPGIVLPWRLWNDYVSLPPTVYKGSTGNWDGVNTGNQIAFLAYNVISGWLTGGVTNPGIPHFIETYIDNANR